MSFKARHALLKGTISLLLSGKPLSHHSHQHPHSPDPNHLITDSPHLPQLIKLPFIKAHSTHAPRPVYCSLPRTVPDSLSTNLCVLTFQFPSCLLRSSCVVPVRPPTPGSGSPVNKRTLSVSCMPSKGQSAVFPLTCHSSHPYSSVIQINLLVNHLPVCVRPVV